VEGLTVAKKGELKAVMHLNIGLDDALSKALEASAARNERRLNEEVRFVLRQHYNVHRMPAEESAGVSA
jgi:hypothetical protein